MGLFENAAVREAEKIQTVIDYRILHAIWDEYSRIQSTPPNKPTRNSQRATTPVWTALTMLRSYKGNFNKMAKNSMYYLKTIHACIDIYNEVLKVLRSHHYTEEEAQQLFDTHPD